MHKSKVVLSFIIACDCTALSIVYTQGVFFFSVAFNFRLSTAKPVMGLFGESELQNCEIRS